MEPITYTEGHFSGNRCAKCRYFRYEIEPLITTWCTFGEKVDYTNSPVGLCNEFIEK